MKKFLLALFFIPFGIETNAQTVVSIPEIQSSGNSTTLINKNIKTSGIVTATFFGSDNINGFFLQDPIGDGNPNTSDGIFVYTSNPQVKKGDKIELTAFASEFYGKTQLKNVSNLKIISQNHTIQATKIEYNPSKWDWEKYEGMLVEFDQILYVSNNDNLKKEGMLELRFKRQRIPTNVALPKTTAYYKQIEENNSSPIYLDDGYKGSYHTPIVFADENDTRRTGERIKNLRGVVDYSYSKYRIYPANEDVVFFGNPRQAAHGDIGNYNLKVCSFNLEYYLTQNYGTGFGAGSTSEAQRQHTKIVEALKAIDADIYGLIEIEQGQAALEKLTNALNTAAGINRYAYINDGGNISGTYTKVGYIYNKNKVTPHKQLKSNNAVGPRNRKKAQAFTLKSNNERFIFSLNHFKSKSGCSYATGSNSDQGDGQSCFNAKRVEEATSTLKLMNTSKSYYEDEDVLIMGDLNAYAKEDPIQTFVNAGYTDLIGIFEPDTAYSYIYHNEVGYLDHALANESMAQQITGVSIFHINSDEQETFGYSGSGYQANMYRCSDHDPVIVGLRLGENTSTDSALFENKVSICPTVVSSYFKVKEAENAYLQIYSTEGIKVFQKKLQTNDETIFAKKDFTLPAGTYIVRVLGENRIKRQIILIK